MNSFIGIRGTNTSTVVIDGRPLWSPDGGFDWGYNGAGPTSLAKAMLGEYFSMTFTGKAEDMEEARQDFIDRYFHKFRVEILAPITSATFQLNFDQIGAWIGMVEQVAVNAESKAIPSRL